MQWPHDIGPIMIYMVPCMNTTCNRYDPTDAECFKVEETVLEPGNITSCQQNISTSVLYRDHITFHQLTGCPISKGQPGKRYHTIYAGNRTIPYLSWNHRAPSGDHTGRGGVPSFLDTGNILTTRSMLIYVTQVNISSSQVGTASSNEKVKCSEPTRTPIPTCSVH